MNRVVGVVVYIAIMLVLAIYRVRERITKSI